jgi:hypothetical protein
MTNAGAPVHPNTDKERKMFPRPIRVFERVTRIFADQQKTPRLSSLNERMDWVKGGAIIANVRNLWIPAELAASSAPFGYWRGLHPRKRTDFEMALLTRGHQLCATEPRYDLTVIGISRGRTLERVVGRLIAIATAVDEKVIEVVTLDLRRRYGMTAVHVVAQPLQLQPALRSIPSTRRA